MSTSAEPIADAPLAVPLGTSLPTTVEAVTAFWCSEILRQEVSDIRILSVRHGSSTSIVAALVYAPGTERPGLPGRIFCKGGFNPELIAIAPSLLDTYRREAEFYHYLHRNLASAGMRLPQPYYTGVDSVSGQGIAVLEDLEATNCSFGTPVETWPVDRVLSGVEQLAILHAETWDCGQDPAYAWLGPSDGGLHGIILELTKPGPFGATVPRNLEVLGGGAEHTVLLDRERIVRAFEALWAADAASRFRCFIHGDPHIDNTYMTAAGEPGFLDWQTSSSGTCFHDVAYFLASALSVDDRRRHERRVLQHYLDALRRHGVPAISWDEAWFEYRRQLFHGYVLCLAQPGMQPQENIWALVKRYVTAIVDHRAIELLEGAVTN